MTTPNIPLTEVPSGSLQPSAPVNASLQVIDALMLPNPIVQEIRSTTPTTTDADEGLRWIVGPGATGTFAGHEDEIAYCTAANLFFFYAPQENWQARNLDDGSQLEYTGSGGWQALPGGLGDAPSDGTIYGRQNATWVAAGGGSGGVTSLGAGHGIDIDATTPAVPIVIVDETELDSSLVPFAHSGFAAGNVEDAIVEASTMGGSGVSSVQAGHGVDVDATNPASPIVAVDETELDSSVIPFSHSGFSATNVEDAIVEASAGGGGTGDVVGPASSVNDRIARFDGTSGKLLEDSGVLISNIDPRGKHAVPVMAGAMTPSATGGSAALATIASAANQPDIQSLNFDPTTVEYAQFSIPMPVSWDEGTVTFAPIWSHAATTTNFGVVFQLQGVAVSNDDTIAVNFGTVQTSTDTGGTTNDVYIGPESAAITLAGTPAAGDVVFFRIGRLTTDGGDTMAIDARLHGIVLYITTNAPTDA